MASTRSFPDRINYALTLGLQYTGRGGNDDETVSPPPRTAEQMILGMGYKPEPSIVYTMKLKYKIDGVDWRRESRWKNVTLQASDGFSLPFHGTLLRSAAEDFFSSVSLSTPDAPVENFPLPMFKTDGLLVLHDLIYKGYATIPRNMLIDILIQLSAIDPALIKKQKTDDDDPPKAESSIPTKKTTTFKRCLKKRLTFRRKMARLFVPSSKLRNKSRLNVPMKWKVTPIPKPIESTTGQCELPTTPVDLIPPNPPTQTPEPPTTQTQKAQTPPPPSPPPTTTTTFTDLTSLSNPETPPSSFGTPQKEEPEILIIDLLTPTSTPLPSPNSKSSSYCPESSSETLIKNISTASSSPESPRSPKSPKSTTSLPPPPSPIRTISLRPKRKPILIPPSNESKSTSNSSTQIKPSNRVYKRARMSTSQSSYLETILAFKRKLNMAASQKCS